LSIRMISRGEMKEFIDEHHRHNSPPKSVAFCTGVADGDGNLVGVASAGNPVAPSQHDGVTLEVTRCCTDGTPNAVSMLYGAMRRAAKALGAERLITYTLASEPGTSLRASGWRIGRVGNEDRSGNSCPPYTSANRPKPPSTVFGGEWQSTEPKVRWEIDL